ncbi:heme-binding protein [Actibacterium sp. 188UL27-1]|nr:heme-binding protein [Actibacterium sp. 188UL27-1]
MSTIAGANMYKGYEIPTYSVQQADGPFEVRLYEPHLVAEVAKGGSRNQAASSGFRTLAKFIFGGNSADESIAMTAPVSQIPGKNGWLVRFAMPSQYDMEALPKPMDDTVRIVEVPGDRQATIQFSGRWNSAKLREKEQALRAWMAERGLTAAGSVRYYFYDDPFTMPWNRRNEVAIAVN